MSAIEILDIRPVQNAGNVRAFLSLRIGGVIVHGAKIVAQPGQRPWVAMPDRQWTADDGRIRYAAIVELSPELKKTRRRACCRRLGGRPMSLSKAALTCAGRLRWPVFPCAAGGKAPALAGGRGCLDATCHPTIIARWWRAMPSANVGIAMGPAAGWALDIDGDAGEESLLELIREHGPLPETVEQLTPGGRHLLFRHGAMPAGAPRPTQRHGHAARRLPAAPLG